MPDYGRAHVPGGTSSSTADTDQRQTFLTDAEIRSALWEAIGTLVGAETRSYARFNRHIAFTATVSHSELTGTWAPGETPSILGRCPLARLRNPDARTSVDRA
jgi:hypothetical protein